MRAQASKQCMQCAHTTPQRLRNHPSSALPHLTASGLALRPLNRACRHPPPAIRRPPTFSIARAISSPISRSPLAEMVPTCYEESVGVFIFGLEPASVCLEPEPSSQALWAIGGAPGNAMCMLSLPQAKSLACCHSHVSKRTWAISSVVEIILARALSSPTT